MGNPITLRNTPIERGQHGEKWRELFQYEISPILKHPYINGIAEREG